MTSHTTLELRHDIVKAFCERWQVRELALFGSAARGELRPESDVDVMVEFVPGETWDLLDLVEMQLALEQVVGRPVDLIEKGTVRNPFRLATIARDITVIYAA